MSCCCQGDILTLNIRQPDKRHGSHIRLLDSLSNTISKNTSKCTQIYLGDPITYQCRQISAIDKQKVKEHCDLHHKSFYVHCPLIANLAKSDCDKSKMVIQKELDIVAGLPAACVLHIGKKGTIENVSQHINDMSSHLPLSSYSHVPFHLLLEIAAGQGTELGKSWEEIRHLYEGLDMTRVGLCIDTQHAFASGMCEFQTHEDVVKLFDMASSIAPKGISMIHLNDSTKPFKSQVDRHAPLKQGYIWSRNDEGLKSLVKISTDLGIDLITETSDPNHDRKVISSYLNLYD